MKFNDGNIVRDIMIIGKTQEELKKIMVKIVKAGETISLRVNIGKRSK